MRKNTNSKIFDFTRSDHKPVIAKIQIKWTYTKKATGTRSFNLSKLQNTQVAENYMKQVKRNIKNETSTTSKTRENGTIFQMCFRTKTFGLLLAKTRNLFISPVGC